MRIPRRKIIYCAHDRAIRKRCNCGTLCEQLPMVNLSTLAIDYAVANEDEKYNYER
jgi:hypothetical protein